MFQIAMEIGHTLRDVIRANGSDGQEAMAAFGATMIMAGQIKGRPPRLFLIYPEGNVIEASDGNPFFQIGKTKHGEPILARAYDPATRSEEAIKLLLDHVTCRTDARRFGQEGRVTGDGPYYRAVSDGWGEALKFAFMQRSEFRFD